MPITFGAIIINAAKNYTKNAIKRKGIDFISRSISYYKKTDIIKIGKYTMYKATDRNYDFKDAYKAYKAVNKSLNIGKSQNIKQFYNKGKSISNNVDSIFKKGEIRNLRIQKQFSYKLNEFDAGIFKFTQENERLGKFKLEDLVKEDNGRYLNTLTKNLTLKSNLEKEFVFSKYDANVIFKEFENEKLNLDDLKQSLENKYKNFDEVEKQFKIYTKRLEKNLKNGYVDFNTETGIYSITQKGLDEMKNVRQKFNFTSYDANVIFSYIDKADGHLSVDQLEKFLDLEYRSTEKLNQMEYLEKRFESNLKDGYIGKDINGYYITEKGFDAAKTFVIENIDKTKERLELLEKMGYINIRPDDYIEVTDLFYLNLEGRNLLDPKELTKSNIENKAKIDPNFKINYYHRYIINELENNPEGITPMGIYEKYKNDITIENPLKKANSFINACEKLVNNGYLVKVDEAYFTHSLTRKLIDGEFKFSYADVRIFRDLQKDKFCYSSENIKNKFAGEDKKIKMISGRIKKLERSGYIKSVDSGYIVTELGNTKCQEFKSTLNSKFGIKEFSFSKYDANVIFKYFNEGNSLTLDELKTKLADKFTDAKEVESQYNIISKRLDKLEDHNYIKFDNEKQLYFITEKGFSEAKSIRGKFQFTSYDSNVLFGYINKSNGYLSKEKLSEYLKEEYKSVSERFGQLEYLENRFKNNNKEGFIGLNSNGCYYITEKGREASEKIQEELIRRTKTFGDKAKNIKTSTIEEKVIKKIDISNFKLTSIDTQILNKALEGEIDLEERLLFFNNRYKENNKEIKKQITIWEVRCNKLELTGYLELKNGVFQITEKGISYLNSKVDIKNIKEFVLGKFDIDIVFKNFKDNQLTINDLEDYLKGRYTNLKEYERQNKIIKGRLKKLTNNGYLTFDKKSNIYNITKYGIDEIEKYKFNSLKNLDQVRNLAKNFKLEKNTIIHINKFHTERKFSEKTYFLSDFDYKKEIKNALNDLNTRIEKNFDTNTGGYCFFKTFKNPIGKDFSGSDLFTIKIVLREDGQVWTAYPVALNNFVSDKFNITRFDYSNIYEVSQNKIWSVSLLKNKFSDLSDTMLQNKIFSVQKRLSTLEEVNAVKYIGSGEYELSDFYIERAFRSRQSGLDKLTSEQKRILFDLKDFYNLTDNQIQNNIYKNFETYSKIEAKKLVSDEYINVTSRDLYGNGKYTNVYYLTPKGKKAISHLSGTEVDKIFDSKLHHRPEELKHDLYVYSAYKDMEKQLLANGYTIDNKFTDKDLRSLDMKTAGKQRIEYPDLRIEFTDTNTGEKGFINVEMDCGYKPNVIKSKSENIDNLVWYTDSSSQANRIINTVEKAKVIVIDI